MSLSEAFHAVCTEAKAPECWYVALMETVPRYGGPEEGGWWTNDTHVVAYQTFPTRELADAAAEQVGKLAAESNEQAKREFGEQCLREMEWLDARGLDADYLREVDGETTYKVVVSEEFPQGSHGPTHYE